MNHDEISELLGAYALDAVDDDERAAVEAHLPACARCRAEVHEHRETAALLAHTGGDAPAHLWDRIAGALEEPPPPVRLVAADEAHATGVDRAGDGDRRRGAGRSPWQVAAVALAAAAAVVVAVLGFEVRRQDDRIDDLQVALRDPLAASFEAALDAPGTRLLELESPDGTTVVRGAVTSDGIAYLHASALPALGPDRTYQLWGATGDELVSIGVLGNAPRIVTFPAGGYDLFAITEEEAPGVVVSDQPAIVAGELT